MSSIYRDRSEAGRHLATLLSMYEQRPDVLVLALPRGGCQSHLRLRVHSTRPWIPFSYAN
ncbi:hypothetical protein KSX_05870 [Ktedonospora formicarum]|uniref:Uncharacterized protein n=1 Tax=Ktedonospora formicarum TaxID=2778364 RepID=A0A8J3HYS5_9CHLR|nr:hypothetical protein KSX_05870 [Ktedonospora formicarum]